ncbi:MAG: DUF4159 domain-containing protein [Acidobacteriota bacterium]
MRPHPMIVFFALLGFGALGVLYAQKEFREYPGQSNVSLPRDWREPHEWVWARLRYSDGGGGFGGFGGGGFGGGGGRRGGGGGGRWGAWATDYSKGDRILVSALKRLTLLDTRSVEQTVDMDGSDDAYNWPFLYAVEVGRWNLSDAEAKQLRDFINRGGFFMVDDFHGDSQWESFMASFEKVFPDRDVIDIPDEDAINGTVFDLNPRKQIPGAQFMRSGVTYEQPNDHGYPAHWRGVYDDKKRLVAVMTHNSDLGDAVEYADDPQYPEQFAQAAFRVLSNYAVYDLTH